MRVLVTGGAGFIGSHIAQACVKEGYDVVVFDNLLTGKLENLSPIRDKITFIQGDLRHPDEIKEAIKGVDMVSHQAALPSVPRSIANPKKSLDINFTGTLNLLLASLDEGVKRVVFASSSSVYGNSETLPKVETMESKPVSPYAFSKHAGEILLKQFHDFYGLETLSLRYFNIFGPRQDPSSHYSAAIPKFIKLIKAGKQPIIYGDGTQSRDFTFIENVVHANLLALKAPKTSGEAINIACGERHELTQVVKHISELLGVDIKPQLGEPRAGDVKHSLADISKAKKVIGYDPIVSFEKGLRKTVEWYG